ncbi:hypothetical protein SAMN04487936_103335 [Halobacillus dabanensis]|uniref:Uncharacterized protein n=2 Tax=Halobacillus dabanensis TaxID=240302 RepID=A0A1I3TGS3_HALDA|nr:hypothetical protein SAMN04487936_103335 [Halobacillus dabanensis]
MYKLVVSLFFVLLVTGAQPSAAYVVQENPGSKPSKEENGDRDLPAKLVLLGPEAEERLEITNPAAVFEVMKAIENANQTDRTEDKGEKLGTLELKENKWMAIHYSKDRSSVLFEWEEKTSFMERRKFFALFQAERKAEPLPPGEGGDVQPIPPADGVHSDDIIPLP